MNNDCDATAIDASAAPLFACTPFFINPPDRTTTRGSVVTKEDNRARPTCINQNDRARGAGGDLSEHGTALKNHCDDGGGGGGDAPPQQ